MLKIGAYKVGNDRIIGFKKTKNIEKILKIADEHIGDQVVKSIDRETLINLLGKLGKVGEKSKKALEGLPANTKRFQCISIGSSIEILSDDNHILSITRKISNPIWEMIKSIPNQIRNNLR